MLLRSTGLVLLAYLAFSSGASGVGMSGGGTFDSFLLSLQPEITRSVSPAWMVGEAVVDADTQMVDIPVGPLWLHSGPEAYALTVVFQDDGDGGPAVEWRDAEGELTVLSHGLGGIGKAVGLNSRTVLVPKSLACEGGSLLVSYYGNFDALISLSVAPLREETVAVAGLKRSPVMIDADLRALEDREVNGSRPIPLGGDLWTGNIIEAELAAETEQLDGSLEFIVPVEGEMEGSMLHLEALGLDPAAKIQVAVNGVAIGSVNMAVFQLDDPSLVIDWNGSLIYAGWRNGSLFLPVDKLRQGDNSIVLTLERSAGETGRDVFLRNAGLHIRFKHAPVPFEGPADEFRSNPTEVDFNLIDPVVPHEFLPLEPPDAPAQSSGLSAP